ncbi:hypothetical protein BDE02_12G039000 [Populus trichocarpa]|uniref:Uncharacterized protein n=1 Tax=Populus trichocarpa TaxID=3694 RepID=A0A3N7HB58_POPTR|nr:hypothetical protein BDE02_12G039000 [Populus trichocarpa]
MYFLSYHYFMVLVLCAFAFFIQKYLVYADRWVSRKSKGKMSPPEVNSKEPNQTQSMFPLLYLPLGPVPV